MTRRLHLQDLPLQSGHLLADLPTRSHRLLLYSSHDPQHSALVGPSHTTVDLCSRLVNLVHLRDLTLSPLLFLYYNDPLLDSVLSLVEHLPPCVELSRYATSHQRWI